MKIAYLVNQYPQPSQSFIRREIAALESLGAQVARFTLRRWPGELVDQRDRDERQKTRAILEAGAGGLMLASLATLLLRPAHFFHALAMALRLGRKSERGRWIHLIYLAEACLLLRYLHRERVDHVHAHFGTNSTTVAMLCRMLGGPGYSFTTHGPEEFDSPRNLALGEKVARAEFAVAISDFGRSQLYRWTAKPNWPKIYVVRCAVDESFLDQPLTPPPDEPRLVCVARLGETKGHHVLVEAAARLAERGVDFRLTLVGDGPLRESIEASIARHDLSRQVRLTGWMSGDDIRREILASRAMVLPSFAEGLPVVFMESLALGRPVIASWVAGTPELVRSDASGWLVAPGSVDDLVIAMTAALSASVQTLARMGAEGRRAVEQRHDARSEARKLLDLFRRYAMPQAIHDPVATEGKPSAVVASKA